MRSKVRNYRTKIKEKVPILFSVWLGDCCLVFPQVLLSKVKCLLWHWFQLLIHLQFYLGGRQHWQAGRRRPRCAILVPRDGSKTNKHTQIYRKAVTPNVISQRPHKCSQTNCSTTWLHIFTNEPSRLSKEGALTVRSGLATTVSIQDHLKNHWAS